MATCAAPYFFKPYYIEKHKSFFLDGGLHLNNPSREAYLYALNYHKENLNVDMKYLIVSLGTGTFIKDRFDTNPNFNYLTWKLNMVDLITSPQELNTDYDMRRLIKNENDYLRLQPELSKEISLDDTPNIPSIVETAYIYIEELKNSDDNKFNKIVESLDLENKFIQ